MQLQVCKAIRHEYALAYFGNGSTFAIDDSVGFTGRPHLITKWLTHMGQQYLRLIGEDHIILVDGAKEYGRGWGRGAARKLYQGNGMVFIATVVSRMEAIELYEARKRDGENRKQIQ